ncbi:RNA polymerase subunit sigma-24 [bacterium]|nr:sigma-70 family RNA polymerase sigma factor [Chloroflexi bacterium CFX6]RIL08488.1 MAG: RNA polymerase subunit sigma-24 [bacterium]
MAPAVSSPRFSRYYTVKEPPVHDEHELIRRAQEYDPAAFGEIYERYYIGVYKYVYYRIGDQTAAEDMTMEVFLKAMEAIDGFTFRGIPFSAWLYRIASNLVVDFFRRQPVQPSLSLEEKLVANTEHPLHSLDVQFSHQALREALADLTDEQQQVIILKFVDGLSNIEVAQVLGKTEGAVKSLQHRALAALGRVLGEQGEATA